MSSDTDTQDLVTSNTSSNYALYVASASGLLSSSISSAIGSSGNGNHVVIGGGGSSATGNGPSSAVNTNLTSGLVSSSSPTLIDLDEKPEKPNHHQYLKDFRVEQCPNFLQHKCTQHKPYTCFRWHFQNQRRRRPVKRRDGQFNYSPDVYCSKYDETTGICEDGDDCPYLHRTSGDTERRYHLRYYKTGICVYDTDSRGYCVKNGQHCAFAHGIQDLRSPVYDIRELQSLDSGQTLEGCELNSLEKERNAVNEDPRWNDSLFVLINYKTELCKRPPRICRQGYACPQYHNSKDKRRSPKKFKYRSTPCPNVKQGDEWGDPGNCESGEGCSYCHTRTEQQFHPEIYKSTKCYDILQTSYCPRGPFCAFAHNEKEMHLRHELMSEINSDQTTSKGFASDLLSASSATSHYTGSFASNGKAESATGTCSGSSNNNNNNNHNHNNNNNNSNNNNGNSGQVCRTSNPLSVSGVNLNNNHQTAVASSLPDRYGISFSTPGATAKLDLAGSHFAEAGIIRNLPSSVSTDPGVIAPPPRLRSATNPPLMQRLTSNNADTFSRRQSSGFLSSPPFHSTLFPRSDVESVTSKATTTLQDDPSQPAYWDEYFRDESNNSTLNGTTATNDPSRFERSRDSPLCGSAPVNIPSGKRDSCFPFGNGLSISPTSSYGISPFPRNPPSSSVDHPLFLGSASPPSHRAMVVEAAAYSIEIQRLKDELSRANEELAEYQKIVTQQNQTIDSLKKVLNISDNNSP